MELPDDVPPDLDPDAREAIEDWETLLAVERERDEAVRLVHPLEYENLVMSARVGRLHSEASSTREQARSLDDIVARQDAREADYEERMRDIERTIGERASAPLHVQRPVPASCWARWRARFRFPFRRGPSRLS